MPSSKRKCPLPMMPKIKKLYDPEPRMKFSASVCMPQISDKKQLITTGSDSFRKMLPDPQLTKNFSDKVSFCEVEQKTLTSVKKTQKISNNQLSSLSPPVHPPKSRMTLKARPSQEFMENVVTNKNNMLKPPNWTQRKQSLMKRHNFQDSPSLVSNIDYHLNMLSSMYKQKNREDEPSLLDQLIEANPSNASYVTPSNTSKMARSLYSGKRTLSMLSSSSIGKSS